VYRSKHLIKFEEDKKCIRVDEELDKKEEGKEKKKRMAEYKGKREREEWREEEEEGEEEEGKRKREREKQRNSSLMERMHLTIDGTVNPPPSSSHSQPDPLLVPPSGFGFDGYK